MELLRPLQIFGNRLRDISYLNYDMGGSLDAHRIVGLR